jgi:hypothetical protein
MKERFIPPDVEAGIFGKDGEDGRVIGKRRKTSAGHAGPGTLRAGLIGAPVVMEQAAPLDRKHPENALLDDPLVHLGDAVLPVGEHDRHLHYSEARLPHGELHLYLERIADEAHPVQVERLEDPPPVADEARGGVFDGHPGDDPGIDGSRLRKEIPVQRPVLHPAPFGVAGAHRHVGSTDPTGFVKPFQIVRVVREVGVHLEEVFIPPLQAPFETMYISGTQTEFAHPLLEEESAGVIALQPANRVGGPVGRSVVDHENVVAGLHAEDVFHDGRDVVQLVVGGYYDQFVRRHAFLRSTIWEQSSCQKETSVFSAPWAGCCRVLVSSSSEGCGCRSR